MDVACRSPIVILDTTDGPVPVRRPLLGKAWLPPRPPTPTRCGRQMPRWLTARAATSPSETCSHGALLVARCNDAYRKASYRTPKQFNAAVPERLDAIDGRTCRLYATTRGRQLHHGELPSTATTFRAPTVPDA